MPPISRTSFRTVLAPALLLAVVICLYAASAFNEFVWDDQQIIVLNDDARTVSDIGKIFLSPDVVYLDEGNPYYRPISRLSFLLDYQLFGLNPAGYHAVNVAIHGANVLVLYAILLLITRQASIAMSAALLFAVHPINTETVSFIVARNNMLAALFSLLAVYTFWRFWQGKSLWHYLGSGLCYLLALLSKESAGAVPLFVFVLALSTAPRSKQGASEALGALWIYCLMLACYVGLRSYALLDTAVPVDIMSGIGTRLLQNLVVIPAYLRNVFWPLHLTAYYETLPLRILHPLTLLSWLAILGGIILIAYRRQWIAGMGVVWFVVNYLPISNIVPFPSAIMADRFIYLPAIGLWVALATVFPLRLEPVASRYRALVPVVIALALSFITVGREAVWRNGVSLYSSIVDENPDSVVGHCNLALEYVERGDAITAERQMGKAIESPQRSVNKYYAYNLSGSASLRAGNSRAALECFRNATKTFPGQPYGHYLHAVAAERSNNPEEARDEYKGFLSRINLEDLMLLPEVMAHLGAAERQDLKRVTFR